MKPEFTMEQIKNWRAFEEVREGGHYNMFDPDARTEACLSRDAYMFVLKNYSELKLVAEQPKVEA